MTCMHSFIHSADTWVATHYKPSVKLDSRNNVVVKIEHEVYTVVGGGDKSMLNKSPNKILTKTMITV